MATLADIVGPVPASLNMLAWGALNLASDFSTSKWTRTGSSITTGITSPSGVTNAQKLVESSGGTAHNVKSNVNPQTWGMPPISHRLACIAKADGRTRIVMFWQNGNETNSTISVGFDLSGGNVGYDEVVGTTSTLDAVSMQDLGGGWWLCIMEVTMITSPAGPLWTHQISIDAGSGTAARNISYSGNGSSGVDLWWFNCLPKAAWSITNLAFHDDFDDLSTIDVNNTMAPGFKWYVNNLAPNSSVPSYDWQSRARSEATAAATLTIDSPSVLKIFNPNDNQATRWGSMIWSVACPDSGGYIGSAFSPPMVFDGYFSFDGSKYSNLTSYGGLGPAFWGSSIEALTNIGLAPPNYDFLEWDVTDVGGHNNAVWDIVSPAGTGTPDGNNTPAVIAAFTPGVFNRISGLWLDSASTGGTWGYFVHFLNGQYVDADDFSYSATAQIPSLSHPGWLWPADNHHLPVFIDTGQNITAAALGGGWPLYIDWVKVYTASSPPPAPRAALNSLSPGIGLGLTMN